MGRFLRLAACFFFFLVLSSSSNPVVVVTATEDAQLSPSPIIKGHIVSCSGWSLNRLPVLKEFLKGGGAESYENVSVEYKSGRKAVLEIFHDDVSVEKIQLQELQTEEELNDIFIKKGFKKKSPEEIVKLLEQKKVERELENAERKKKRELRRQKYQETQRKADEMRQEEKNEKNDVLKEKEYAASDSNRKDRNEAKRPKQKIVVGGGSKPNDDITDPASKTTSKGTIPDSTNDEL